jgi:hypothetical protein
MGTTQGMLMFNTGIRTDAKMFDVSEQLIPASQVTSYQNCNSLYVWKGKEQDGKTCTYSTPADFAGFYSMNSPYIRFLANEHGNALQKDFAEDMLQLAAAWNDHEGGEAALGLYSVSTGVHSCTSKHNVGLAIDISGCYDTDGSYHDSKQADALFQRCEQFLLDQWKYSGLFISYRNCVTASGAPCSNKAELISTHYNHIHIQEG